MEAPEVQAFLNMYSPETPVMVGRENPKPMTLGKALDREAMYCVADDSVREDPTRRLGYLAGILAGGGSLLPEHELFLAQAEDQKKVLAALETEPSLVQTQYDPNSVPSEGR